jgi:hypothetical protein
LRYQDVAGLVNLYAASPALLSVIGLDGEAIVARRVQLLAEWSVDGLLGGTRPATLAQSMAVLGLDAFGEGPALAVGLSEGFPDALTEALTVRSGVREINQMTAPKAVLDALSGTQGVAVRNVQPELVRVRLVGSYTDR